MKTENKEYTFKGKKHSGVIAWPEDLSEALTMLSEREVWSAFKIGYAEICKRQICGIIPRPRNRKLDVSDLAPEHQDVVLDLIASLRAENQLSQQAQKNVPPELQPISQIDSVEMQEEVSTEVSAHVGEFEQDFAKYLTSLDSSPQQHMETAQQQPETTEDPRQSSPTGLFARLFR